jgi:hypothetical protein
VILKNKGGKMIGKITKILYWKDRTDKNNLYHIQVEYDGKYAEVSLITEDEFEEIKNKYGNLMEEVE